MCIICDIIDNLKFVRHCSKCKATNPKIQTQTFIERLDATQDTWGCTLGYGADVYRTNEGETFVEWVEYFCPICCQIRQKSRSWTIHYEFHAVDYEMQDITYDTAYDMEVDDELDVQFDEYDEMVFDYLDRLGK